MTTQLTKPPTKVTAMRSTERFDRTTIAVFPADREGGAPVQGLCKITPDGALKAIQVSVPLNPDTGEVWFLPTFKKVGGDWVETKNPIITAIGYDKINTVAGIRQIVPETLLDEDGIVRANPYIKRLNNDHRAEILYVKYRMIGEGRSKTGNLTRYDLTITYNLATYFAQDLYAKWTGKKSETPKEWGILMPAGEPLGPQAKGRWRPYDMPAGVTLWVDLTQKDVVTLLGEQNNRQKFAERNAGTITWRNILRRFFAVAKLVPDADRKLYAPVVAWIETDADALESMQLQSGPAALTQTSPTVPAYTPSGVKVEQLVEKGEASGIEVEAAMAGDADEDMGEFVEHEDAPPDSIAPTPQGKATSDRYAALRAKIRSAADKLPVAAVDGILSDLSIEGMLEVSRLGDEGLLKQALDALEKAVLEQANERAKSKTAKKPSSSGQQLGL